jgi:hypothetical protein
LFIGFILLSWQKAQLFYLCMHLRWNISLHSAHLKMLLFTCSLFRSPRTTRLSQIKHFLLPIFPIFVSCFSISILGIRFSTLFLSFMYLSAMAPVLSCISWTLSFLKPPSRRWLYLWLLASLEYLFERLSSRELEKIFLLPK